MTTPHGTQWYKSSYSSDCTANCVEIADLTDSIAIRDSKVPNSPVLRVSREAFSGFRVLLAAAVAPSQGALTGALVPALLVDDGHVYAHSAGGFDRREPGSD
ncbi:DUF397 domain-containing protein [Streptomyces sp. NPDC008141]|uniref:DUF397 domain-containing protein n=1 Tax=Streptomyces sp. NPDC008141 TaxID=3364815 RepID=UPI0036E1CA52